MPALAGELLAFGDDVLGVVLTEASATLGGTTTILLRHDPDGAGATVVAVSDDSVRAGDPAPADAAGVPVVVEGRSWGLLAVVGAEASAAPALASHLARYAEMASAALAGAQARHELRRLIDEQSALRRVAELVARNAPEEELFDAVATEAAQLIDEGANLVRFDGPRAYTVVATSGGPAPVGLRVDVPEDDEGTAAEVLRTHRPARRDDYRIGSAPLFGRPDFGAGSSVSVPILVGGRLWGMLGTLTERRRLPAGTEDRLQKFAQLVAAALANSEARADVERLAAEQSAVRRVAELVAHGAGEEELFRAVTVEAAGLVGGEPTTLVRYEGERTYRVLATHAGPVSPGTGIVIPDGDRGAMAQMIDDPYRSVRIDYKARRDRHFVRDRFGLTSSVAVPIRVDDRLWGSLGVVTTGRSLAPETEERVQKFADLVAAALANGQARRELARLADEQAALRRVAELVARNAPLEEVFAATAAEASRLLGDLPAALVRVEGDGDCTVAATCNSGVPLGLRLPGDGDAIAACVQRTGEAVRVSSYAGSDVAALAARFGVGAAVGVPIVVEGRIRAVLATSTAGDELPAEAEGRLGELAALAAAAIANAENRAALAASRARVIATADETRRRLQRDVHDGAQQRLVQTIIALEIAQDALARGSSPASMVDEALNHAQRAMSELRELVQGLLPGALSRGGLRAAIEALVIDLPMPVHLDVTAPALPRALETTAYFVVAEALTNVVKHAEAQRVDVRVTLADDAVVVEVADDGVGGADPSRGTGLTGLSDRVEAAEGALAVTSRPGFGTALRATLPVGPAHTRTSG